MSGNDNSIAHNASQVNEFIKFTTMTINGTYTVSMLPAQQHSLHFEDISLKQSAAAWRPRSYVKSGVT